MRKLFLFLSILVGLGAISSIILGSTTSQAQFVLTGYVLMATSGILLVIAYRYPAKPVRFRVRKEDVIQLIIMLPALISILYSIAYDHN